MMLEEMCFDISSSQEKLIRGVRETPHPSACNQIQCIYVFRCAQNWTKTNCCGRGHSEYTVTCKGSQYKINTSLNKVFVFLGRYGSYAYFSVSATFGGAHC